jgi:hypothetical protein
VPWWTWIALGVLACVLVTAAVYAVYAVRVLKRLQATGEALASRAEEVARANEELETRLAHAGERADVVQQHLGRLEGSLERLSVLSWALGDARKGIARVRGAYLRK